MPVNWVKDYIATQHEWVHLLDPNATPPVDIFPFLTWIPAMYATWKRRAQNARKGLFLAYSALVDHAHQSRQDDANNPRFESLVERLLRENQSPSEVKEPILSKRDIKFIAGGVLDGAFDTSYHTSLNLLKTFAAHPAIQKRVQHELDEAWYVPNFEGRNCLRRPKTIEPRKTSGKTKRMFTDSSTTNRGHDTGVPELIDLGKLPYLHCCVLEVLRWRPTTPMALARRVVSNDDFLGYRIPKDATAMINVWAIQHDPEAYDHPDEYDPERFVRNPLGTKPDEVDTDQGRMPLYVFGAGRRACPGEQFAMNAIKFAFAQLLRSYNIVADEEMDMSVEKGFIASFLLMSNPYKVRIVSRSEKAKVIVKNECCRANEFLAQAME